MGKSAWQFPFELIVKLDSKYISEFSQHHSGRTVEILILFFDYLPVVEIPLFLHFGYSRSSGETNK